MSGLLAAARARLRRAATLPIRLYRRWLSPLKPPMCRFQPTCSQYAIEALETHGLLRGSALAVWRLLRCQPFAKGGWDPVPPRRGGGGGDAPEPTERPGPPGGSAGGDAGGAGRG